jgi:hypothetical protein
MKIKTEAFVQRFSGPIIAKAPMGFLRRLFHIHKPGTLHQVGYGGGYVARCVRCGSVYQCHPMKALLANMLAWALSAMAVYGCLYAGMWLFSKLASAIAK